MDSEKTTNAEGLTIEPCNHMRRWVGGLADGSLKGPACWYTKFHVATCPKCSAALKEMQERQAQPENTPLSSTEPVSNPIDVTPT